MQRKIAVFILVALLSLVLAPQAVFAGPSLDKRVVFILMDNITWADIIAANDPTLNELIEESSIGLLNNHPLKMPSRPRNALSVGAGTKALGVPSSFEGYNADEPYGEERAMDAYKLRTGRGAAKGQVLELGIASIYEDNTHEMQSFVPGQLADVIESAGGSTAAFGNADTSLAYDRHTLNREIVTIAMNRQGRVSFGTVGKDILIEDAKYPFGIRTDYKKLTGLFEQALGKANFIAVDLGDTARADFYDRYAFVSQSQKHRAQAIHAGSRFIKQAMEMAGDNTTFIIASLSPPGSTESPLRSSLEQLTPIIVHGPGFSAGGLSSDTTHRDGLVAMIDIAPTVLSVFGLGPGPEMSGSQMVTGPSEVTPESLESFNASAVGMKTTRRVAVLAFIYSQIVLFILAALILAYRKKACSKIAVRVLETVIFATMSFPLFSFYTTKLAGLSGQSVMATLLTVVMATVFASVLVAIRRKELQPIFAIALLNVTVVSAEILMGGPSFINSIFGYDPIRGARFFGIGNEAMAIFMANGLLLFGLMLEKAWNRWTILAGAALAAFMTVLIGFPGLGTNTDGPITTTAAFTVMLLVAMRSKAKLRNFVIATSAVVTVLALFAGYDVLNGATTHMGKSVLLIANGGFVEVLMIVKRKLATNMQILRFSTWSYFLLVALGLLAFLWFKPAGVLRELLANHRGLSAAISASIVGGTVGFAFNDSGILVPAIIMSYMIPTVIYLMLWEQYHSTG